MSSPPRPPRSPFCIEKSRLGQSLLRLHQTLEQGRAAEEGVETLLSSWQKKWSTRRDEIANRLELIEQQLDELGRPSTAGPRLSIVGVPIDADQMTGMM
ncbi:MAG: hypothetical protein AB7O26_16385 [Planctomycetaceae bacterium]